MGKASPVFGFVFRANVVHNRNGHNGCRPVLVQNYVQPVIKGVLRKINLIALRTPQQNAAQQQTGNQHFFHKGNKTKKLNRFEKQIYRFKNYFISFFYKRRKTMQNYIHLAIAQRKVAAFTNHIK